MSKKRKISVRKILQVFTTLVLSSACIVAILSASRIEDARKLKGIEVQLNDENRLHFLDKKELLDTITEHTNQERVPVGMININAIENYLHDNPWVGNAQVYIDNSRMMHVFVSQRVPVVRVFEIGGSSYYIDTTLRSVPLSDRYVQYAVTVTNVPHLNDDSAGRAVKAQILKLARVIQADTFWNVMVSQVMIDSVYGFQLLPVLGNHTIMLGDTSRLQEKLTDVYLFYKKILNNIGWDKYEVIDVRFKDQLVASPALPWKAPAGKMTTNMDWVKSILDQGAKKEEQDSLQKQHVNKLAEVRNKPPVTAKVTQAKPPPKGKVVKPPDKHNEVKKKK